MKRQEQLRQASLLAAPDIRLSSLAPLDLESLRPESRARARQDLRALRVFPVRIEQHTDRRRLILADGRHRVVTAMRLGWEALPARVVEYTASGEVARDYYVRLLLDALP